MNKLVVYFSYTGNTKITLYLLYKVIFYNKCWQNIQLLFLYYPHRMGVFATCYK